MGRDQDVNFLLTLHKVQVSYAHSGCFYFIIINTVKTEIFVQFKM